MFLQKFLPCIFFFAIILSSTAASAQKQFGSVQGTIRDAEGQPIPGVTAVVTSELWGSTDVFTDKGGQYRIESLMPGTYQLQARLVGFHTVVNKDVRISIGSVSIVNFVLEPEKLTESITVRSEAPLIDSTTTSVTHTIPSEIIQGLPDSGGFGPLLALTPGVGNDGVAYGGSPNTSNRVWIDGLDVSSPANGGIFFTTYPRNWIEEVQVVGNGAPAEYGNYLGVIGNFVTRSGGNQFHGLMQTFFHNEDLESTNTPDPSARETPFQSWDLSAQIGGPIIRDKLWFFSGFQYNYLQTTPFGYNGIETVESPKFITKLTYKPNQNNTIQGFVKFAHLRNDGVGADFEVLPETTSVETSQESTWNATWISLLTPATTLEGGFGCYSVQADLLPRNGDIPQYLNLETNVAYGNADKTLKRDRFRREGQFALTHYAENYFGNHEFKFGVQFHWSNARDESSINGGFRYESYYDSYSDYVRTRYSYLQNPLLYSGDSNQVSIYVHDTWNLNRRFALSLGLRWDHNRGSTDRGVVSSADPVAPRIGMIWTLRENKPIVIKAHYGEYYDALLTRQFVLLSDQQFGYQNDDSINGGPWERSYHEQNFYSSVSDTKHPFVRQFIVGTDQELPAGIAAGVHYIFRGWHNFLEYIDTNPVYEPVPFVNPVTGETITVYSRPENTVRYFLLTNPEGLYRRYDGIEVYLNRRFLNQLALSASFVYSKTRGNVPNTREEDRFIDFLDDPNQLINFIGHVVNDPTFALKFSGIYDLPYGLNLGFFFRHQSGDTWEPLVSLKGIVNQEGDIFGLPRGSYRLPSQNILDLRIEKQFEMIGGQFRFTADIFNVLNSACITNVGRVWGKNNYGQPTSFVGSRQIRLGLRYTF